MKVNEIIINEGVISRMIQRNFGKPGTEPGMTFDPAKVQAGVVDEIFKDWQGLVNQYNTAHPGLLSRAYVYQRELDKFLNNSRKINTAKLPRYNLAGVDDASVKNYIKQVKAAYDVANRTRPVTQPQPAPTQPAPTQPAQLYRLGGRILDPNNPNDAAIIAQIQAAQAAQAAPQPTPATP